MKYALATAAALAITGSASAQGFYVEGGYNFLPIDQDEIEADLGAITGRAGYDFSENLSAELEAGFGVQDEEVTIADVETGIDVSLNYLVGAFGKVGAPVTDALNVFARAGIVTAEIEASGGGFNADASDTGFGYGAGADVELSERFGLRIDYTRYDIEDLEADSFAAAFKVRF